MNDRFSTQAEAIKAARQALWGQESSRGTKFLKSTWTEDYRSIDLTVSANVNGRLFVVEFDHYGRVTNKFVLDKTN